MSWVAHFLSQLITAKVFLPFILFVVAFDALGILPIFISAGFKEIGKEGKGLQNEIKEIRERYHMRIIGPNCLGIIRPKIGLNTTFSKV